MNLIEAERLIREFFGLKNGRKEGLYRLSSEERIQLGLMIKYPGRYDEYPKVVAPKPYIGRDSITIMHLLM